MLERRNQGERSRAADRPGGEEIAAGKEDGLLTYREAADWLGVSPRTVWGLVDKGELAAVRITEHTVRLDRHDLEEFVARAKAPRQRPVRARAITDGPQAAIAPSGGGDDQSGAAESLGGAN